MSNLARILSIIVMWLAAGHVQAGENVPPPPVPPFVKVTVPQGPVNLGDICSGGAFQAGAEVKVHIVANCPYQIQASLRDLRRGAGGAPVPADRVIVAINGKRTTLGGKVLVTQTRQATPINGLDVLVGLQVGVTNFMQWSAGRYNGTLVITAMALP